jgi:hypothetical protein
VQTRGAWGLKIVEVGAWLPVWFQVQVCGPNLACDAAPLPGTSAAQWARLGLAVTVHYASDDDEAHHHHHHDDDDSDDDDDDDDVRVRP